MSIHYIIAAWFGPRRSGGAAYKSDKMIFIKKQFEALRDLEHKVDRVTVVINGSMPAGLRALSKGMDTEVVWIKRHNEFGSYGAWDEALKQTVRQFDYHILMEDDIVPVIDNFDSELEKIMEENPQVGYLAQMYTNHPAISCGIARDTAVQQVLFKHKSLWPAGAIAGARSYGATSYLAAEHMQRTMGFGFIDLGFEVASQTNYGIKSMFWGPDNKGHNFGPQDGHALFMPVQMI